MNVCAGGVEGSLLERTAFQSELEEAVKEGIVCCPLPWTGLRDAIQPNLFGENKELIL